MSFIFTHAPEWAEAQEESFLNMCEMGYVYVSLCSRLFSLLFLSLGAHYIIRRVKMHYKLKTEFMPGIFLTYSLNVFTHTNTVRGTFYMHARAGRGERERERNTTLWPGQLAKK